MKTIKILFTVLIVIGLPVFAQDPVKDAKAATEVKESKETQVISSNEVDRKKIAEIETNLKKQQQELEDLKKAYGVKSADNSDKPAKEEMDDTYVSPLKKRDSQENTIDLCS